MVDVRKVTGAVAKVVEAEWADLFGWRNSGLVQTKKPRVAFGLGEANGLGEVCDGFGPKEAGSVGQGQDCEGLVCRRWNIKEVMKDGQGECTGGH